MTDSVTPSTAGTDPSAWVSLRALGGLSLQPRLAATEGQAAEALPLRDLSTRRRKLALLLYLRRQRKPVSRELLATLLWPDEAPEPFSGALRHAVDSSP